MKSFWIAVLCAMTVSSAAVAQQGSPAPQSAAKPADQKSQPSDYSDEAVVVEKYYTTVRFENDGTGERDVSARIRVQSDAGVAQLGELVFGYSSSNEQMDVRTMRVHKADGSVVNAASEAIKDMTASVARDAPEYTDYKEKHITVPSLHAGDTIEYEIVTRIVKALAPGEFWYEQNFLSSAIVLDERLEVNVPQGRALIIDSQDYSNASGQEVRKVKLTANGDGVDDDKSPFTIDRKS